MKVNQYFILILLLAVVCLALSGCQGFNRWLFVDDTPPVTPSVAPTTPPATPSVSYKNDLFGVSWSGQTVIHPLTNDNRFDAQWLPLVYEGLFWLDDAFQPMPLLCVNYTTEDNLTFVFTIHAGVTFHDGTRLTAEDAAWSLITARNANPYAARLEDMLTARALDDTTLEVQLARPNPHLPALLTIPIVPAGSEILDVAPGTGPYIPIMDPSFPHLRPFDAWWQRKPLPLDRLELIEVSSGDQLIYAFESRRLSLVIYNPSDTTGVRFRGDYETWEYDTTILEYIGFNTTRAPTNNPMMRQALAASVDRQAISEDEANSRWTIPTALPVHPAAHSLYDPALAEEFAFDLARMSELFAEMGYEGRNEDGVLEVKKGRRYYPLEIVMVVCVENDHHVRAAQRIADTLIEEGVSVQLEELPKSAYLEALNKGDFDLYYGAVTLTADFSPLPFFKDGSLGFGGFYSAETLARWDDMVAETEETTAWIAFWESFMEQAPIVPVLFQQQAVLMQRGLTTNPRPVWENLFLHLPEWKID